MTHKSSSPARELEARADSLYIQLYCYNRETSSNFTVFSSVELLCEEQLSEDRPVLIRKCLNTIMRSQQCPKEALLVNLLLLGLITYSAQFKTSSISVSGEKRGNITLRCEHEDNNIDQIDLFTRSREIDVCETEECRGRVFKEGNCDVVIKNLIFSDAGKYTLRIYYNNDQTELKYQLHIHDEISVKTGEELKMSVLVYDANKVETNSSGEWKEVWTRDHGVQSDRMNDTDGNLIIKSFLDSDAGSYRVLDTEGEILITVTITASSTESDTESLDDTNKYQTNNTGQHKNWIVSVVVCLVILAVIVISVFIWRRQHRDLTQVQENTENTQELEKL